MRLIRWASGVALSDDLPISDPAPDPGLFGPGSVTWRLQSEQWLIAGGARSFLMQAAHPVVAQATLDHSHFAIDPFGRVHRTIQAMAVISFGTIREVDDVARRINHLHGCVTGTLSSSVGQHTAGAAYSATDPAALLWVHAALIDSVLTAYQSFVGPLTAADLDQYWQESCRYARKLGVPDALLPASYAAMQAYLRDAYAAGEVAVGPAAKQIAHTVLYPRLHPLRRPLWGLVRLLTAGQLPPAIRHDYGLRWSGAHQVVFRGVCVIARLLRRALPQIVGRSAVETYAERRVRGELQRSPVATGTSR
jgi:uncharacterized protein (DUF2236 family)